MTRSVYHQRGLRAPFSSFLILILGTNGRRISPQDVQNGNPGLTMYSWSLGHGGRRGQMIRRLCAFLLIALPAFRLCAQQFGEITGTVTDRSEEHTSELQSLRH